MKNFLKIFLFVNILFAFQKVSASVGNPEIKYFTPADGTVFMISETETGRYVDIYFYIENLWSASYFGWYGYEIWITDNNNQIFHYKDESQVAGGKSYGPLTLHQWLSVGSHAIKISAKSYTLEGLFPIAWIDTHEANKTNNITIKHPFTVNISRTFEFDQSENLPSQHSASGDPIQISVVSTYNHPSGRQYFFAGWSDGNTTNPRTVTDNSTILALYKVVHKSNDATAFSNNSQRRLIETNSGNNPRWLHQVYTSSINGVSHVWIEHSSDGGSSWIIGNNGKPLDGSTGGKNPSIAYLYDSWLNYNYIGVVWQQPYGYHYKIVGMMFSQPAGSSSIPGFATAVTTLHMEPSDAYGINANPNLVLSGAAFGPYFVTFERKSTSGSWQPGINFLVGNIEDIGQAYCGPFGYVESSGGIVIGTNSNTTNTQIDRDLYSDGYNTVAINLIRQQGSLGTIYSHYLYLYKNGGYWEYSQINDGMISYNSPVNFSPSIVTIVNGYYAACWVEYADLIYYSLGSGIRYYYGSDVQSCSINRGGSNNSSSGFAAWSQHGSSWSNKSIRFDNGSPAGSSIYTLSTSGKYVQVGNSASSNLSYMYASSFYPFYSPYYFHTSGTLTPLSKGNPEIVTGRGFDINTGDAAFSYRFGDLNVDGKNISFVDAPDGLDYGKVETLNNALVTEPFQVNVNSKIVFSEMSGFTDTLAAAKKLGKDGFINFKLELIDDATGKVIAPIKSENLNSSNAHSVRTPAYSLKTNGLAGKTIRIKISLESNLVTEYQGQLAAGNSLNIPDAVKARLNVVHSNLILTKSFSEENSTLGKTSLKELAIDNSNTPTVYALDQNYPNPFNPTTIINYQIPKDGLVTLKIYDVLGREVKTLINEQKTTGRYEVKFDASDLASGVYIYQIKVNDFTSSKKMLLMK